MREARRTYLFLNGDIVMVNPGLWNEQRAAIYQFIRSIAYHRNLARARKDSCDNSKFWNSTSTAHLLVATLEWSKVFGSNTEKTHWKNSVTSDQSDEFKTMAIDAAGGEAEWKQCWEGMNEFRCQYVAHTDTDRVSMTVPSFDTPLEIASIYLQWVYDLAREENIYFENNHDPKQFYKNVTEESMPVINGAVATEATPEYS
jgi:hypothetical protein